MFDFLDSVDFDFFESFLGCWVVYLVFIGPCARGQFNLDHLCVLAMFLFFFLFFHQFELNNSMF